MQVAQAWGLTPDEWYNEPRWSRATMVAASMEQAKLDYWRSEDAK